MAEKGELVIEAEKAFKAGKFDKAIKIFQSVLGAEPHDQRIRLRLAEAFAKKKDLAAAIKTFLEVAKGYVTEKFFLKAIAVYKNVLKLNPGAVEANERLAWLYAQMGMIQEAVHQYQIVATTYETKGEHSKAVESRRQIAILKPDEVTGRVRLAELLQREGKDDEAVKEYEGIAALARSKKDAKALIEAYEKITNRRPDRIGEATELVRMYVEREEWERAGRKLDQLGAVVDASPELLEYQLKLFERQDQWEKVKEKARRLLALLIESGEKKKIAALKQTLETQFAEDSDFLKELEELVRLS